MNDESKEHTKEVEEEFPDITAYRMNLIRIKSFATLAVEHLDSVTGEEIPDDAEFRQILWVLSAELINNSRDLGRMYETIRLPGVDDRDNK